jgi:hypothetical protein
MCRTPDAAAGLGREAATLEHLAGLRPPVTGVPRILFVEVGPAGARLGETSMTGVPLDSVLTAGNLPAYATRVTDWLISIARVSQASASREWWDRIAEPVLADFTSSYAAVIKPELIEVTRATIGGVTELPALAEHRDLGPWNILVDGDRIAVLDWESSDVHGLPVLDLIYFLTYATFYVDGAIVTGRYVESYRRGQELRTPAGRLSAACLERYAHELGLDPNIIQPLRLLTWMIHARSEHSRLREDVGQSPTAPALGRAIFAALWREDVKTVS